MQARIVKIVSKHYTLQREDNTRIEAVLAGKIRKQFSPVAGDIVEYDQHEQQYVVEKILPRMNHMIRPAIANVDQALIVMSVKDPNFSPALIDRLSILISASGIRPILIVTKCDMGIDEETRMHLDEYKRGQLRVIETGKGNLNPEIKEILKNKISVLTGQSGAGKSTLLNQLEPTFELATQEISKALGRGKHTTRHTELHPVAQGLVADTPGFSSLDFSHIEANELAQFVPDFKPFLQSCRFNDCVHQNEPGCRIKEAVENGEISQTRYDNYLQVLQMIQERRVKYL